MSPPHKDFIHKAFQAVGVEDKVFDPEANRVDAIERAKREGAFDFALKPKAAAPEPKPKRPHKNRPAQQAQHSDDVPLEEQELTTDFGSTDPAEIERNGAPKAKDPPAEEHKKTGSADGATAETNGVALDDFRAYMPQHCYVYLRTREPWPASSINGRFPAVPLVDAAGKPVLNEKGKPKQICASLWLDQNLPVEQMTWAPGEPILIADRLVAHGGWIRQRGVTCLNLYMPPVIVPGNAAEASVWIEHIYRVFPNDAEHIILWLAHRVQRPGEKINHALVLGGAQGIGKDSLLEPLKGAVGPWNFLEVSPTQLLGRFNGFLKAVILRVSEARDLGDLNRYQFYDHMKAITAAPPDVLRVDEKICASIRSLIVAASSLPQTTRRTASICPRTIAVISSPGRSSPRMTSPPTTGTSYGASTATAGPPTSPLIFASSIFPNSTRRRRRRRPPPFGTL